MNSFVWTLVWIGTFMRICSREQTQFLPTPRLVGMESKTMYWDLPHLHRWANKNPSLLSQIWWLTFHTCNNELKKTPHCYLEVDDRPATSATMSSKQKQKETSIVVSKPMINLPHRWAQNKNKKKHPLLSQRWWSTFHTDELKTKIKIIFIVVWKPMIDLPHLHQWAKKVIF